MKKRVGLANIQRRILREYGKQLQIESAEGKGTKVYFEIPYDVNIQIIGGIGIVESSYCG